MIRHFLGQLNVEQTYGAAFDTDPKTKTAQTCEANFYSGELALLKKNKKEAQRLLKLAADQCPPSFIESTAAVAELHSAEVRPRARRPRDARFASTTFDKDDGLAAKKAGWEIFGGWLCSIRAERAEQVPPYPPGYVPREHCSAT